MKNGPNYYGKAFVTITKVKVTPDLSVARFYLSVYNVDNKEEIIDQLRDHMHDIRGQLGNKLRNNLRRIPELEFFLDETLDEVFRIEKILKDVRKGDNEAGNDGQE